MKVRGTRVLMGGTARPAAGWRCVARTVEILKTDGEEAPLIRTNSGEGAVGMRGNDGLAAWRWEAGDALASPKRALPAGWQVDEHARDGPANLVRPSGSGL